MYLLTFAKDSSAQLISKAPLIWVLVGRQHSCTHWSQTSRHTVALNEEINP